MERGSGVIMYIVFLFGKYGIGIFGRKVYEFSDFLKKVG